MSIVAREADFYLPDRRIGTSRAQQMETIAPLLWNSGDYMEVTGSGSISFSPSWADLRQLLASHHIPPVSTFLHLEPLRDRMTHGDQGPVSKHMCHRRAKTHSMVSGSARLIDQNVKSHSFKSSFRKHSAFSSHNVRQRSVSQLAPSETA